MVVGANYSLLANVLPVLFGRLVVCVEGIRIVAGPGSGHGWSV